MGVREHEAGVVLDFCSCSGTLACMWCGVELYTGGRAYRQESVWCTSAGGGYQEISELG